MAMSSSMRRRSGLTTTEACSWDIEGTSRDEGDPSCSEPHPTPSSSHRLHQLYSTPPQALPRSGFVHGRDPDLQWAGEEVRLSTLFGLLSDRAKTFRCARLKKRAPDLSIGALGMPRARGRVLV